MTANLSSSQPPKLLLQSSSPCQTPTASSLAAHSTGWVSSPLPMRHSPSLLTVPALTDAGGQPASTDAVEEPSPATRNSVHSLAADDAEQLELEQQDPQTSNSATKHARAEVRSVQQRQYQVKTDAYWHERVIKQHSNFGALYIFCIGVSAPCGAIYTTWSNTLPVSGTVNLILAIAAVGFGFVALCCCLGEMSATFPFAGGSFGFARALLGKVPGQVVGVAEYLEWVLIGSGFILLVSQGLTQLLGTDPLLEALWLVLLYALTLGLNLMGGYWLYVPFAINTLVSIAFLLVYQLGMARFADWSAYAGTAAGAVADDGITPETTWVINGFGGFLRALPYGLFTLVGFEICPLIADEVQEPKRSVPRGMVASSVLVCSMAVITIVAAVACPQTTYGDLSSTIFPLTDGFALIFGTTDARVSLVFPVFTQWAAFMTCCMAWGRQSFAMSRSGLLPHWLSLTWKRRGTPAAALITGAVLSLGASLLVRFIGSEGAVVANAMLFNIGIIGCCINYEFQALSYLMLRSQYHGVARPFRSPLGIAGAVYVFVVFGLTLAGVMLYDYIWESLAALSTVLAAGLAYYFLYARFHLIMSPEEYRSLFVLYSMRFIRDKQRKALRGDSVNAGAPLTDSCNRAVGAVTSKRVAPSSPLPQRPRGVSSIVSAYRAPVPSPMASNANVRSLVPSRSPTPLVSRGMLEPR